MNFNKKVTLGKKSVSNAIEAQSGCYKWEYN
jgi:hypothetical protein